MWCRMQAPSPPDALEEEGRRQGERSASSPYHHTMGTLGSTTWVCDCGGPGVLLRGDGGDLWQVRAFERMGERHEVLACRGRSGGAVGRRTGRCPQVLLPSVRTRCYGRASHPARMARRSRKPMALPQVAGHATIAHSRLSPTEGTSIGEQQPRCNLPSTPCTSGCWATTISAGAGGAPGSALYAGQWLCGDARRSAGLWGGRRALSGHVSRWRV